jgi:hypothetical protein
VRYEAQEGGEVDCTGTARAAGTTVTHVFTVDTGTLTLRCANAPGGTPVVVMDNIENMQITYGIDSTRDGVIDEAYKPMSVAVPTAAAVRVSLLVRGPIENVAAGKAQAYTYNSENVTPSDRFLRQVYTSTFTVRNQAR